MKLKTLIKKCLYGYRGTSDTYIEYLKKNGASIGEDVTIFNPRETSISMLEMHMLEIGNHVKMTGPIRIITHDYSWSVIKRKYGVIFGNQKKVTIGNNVFIGHGATILCGTDIGDNTIIGANAVVTGHLEGNAVYAGNPARKIMSLDEYYNKRKNRQLNEAVDFVLQYEKRFGEMPPREKLCEYFFLFESGKDAMPEKFLSQLRLMGNYEESVLKLENGSLRQFDGYEEFIKYCKLRNEY